MLALDRPTPPPSVISRDPSLIAFIFPPPLSSRDRILLMLLFHRTDILPLPPLRDLFTAFTYLVSPRDLIHHGFVSGSTTLGL